MKTTKLGGTGLFVSEIGFGTIPIIPMDTEKASRIIRHCYDLGITFFDTANLYVDTEKKLGKALADVRDTVVLATKTHKRKAKGATAHIELSLKNLNTDVIDLYQFHHVSKPEDIEMILGPDGAMEAAQKAKTDGKLKHIGFTSHDLAAAIKLCRTGLFETVQFPFNFIENEPAGELFEAAREYNMGIIAMKPLGGGLLDRADLCFKFLQQYPDVIPIPGFQSTLEADEVVQLYLEPSGLTQTDQHDIESIRAQLGKRFCHRCGYCMPCEQGVQIVDVMFFRSMSRRLSAPVAIKLSEKAMLSADGCTECGECLEKCPYRLPIPELLKEHRIAFDVLKQKFSGADS